MKWFPIVALDAVALRPLFRWSWPQALAGWAFATAGLFLLSTLRERALRAGLFSERAPGDRPQSARSAGGGRRGRRSA